MKNIGIDTINIGVNSLDVVLYSFVFETGSPY